MAKLVYVTKKQVQDFIDNKLQVDFKSKKEFKKELDKVIAVLSLDGGGNNQLKFYTRVREAL